MECGKAGLFLCSSLLSTCLLHNFLLAGLKAEMESGVRGQRSGSASPLEHSAHVRYHKAHQSGPVLWVMLPLGRLRLK